MTVFYSALAVLAVYRVAHMLTREDGPFDLFARIREKVGQRNWIGRGLACLWCISFWLSAAAAISLAGYVPDWLLLWLGIAGGVLALDKAIGE